KPMLVTLPFTLLLLDVWPLRRIHVSGSTIDPVVLTTDRTPTVLSLVREKLPLFGLALTSSIVTLVVQQRHRIPLEALPLLRRLTNAVISYATYIGKIVWPARLGIFYSYPASLPALQLAV